jgi:hypothetical protein
MAVSAAQRDLAASLTPKQRAFAAGIAEGLDGSAAYRLSYAPGNGEAAYIAAKAYEVRHKPRVSAYIAALISQQEQGRFLSRQRKREILASIAEKRGESSRARVRAIEVDNRMTGDEQPQVVELSGTVSVSIVEAVRRQRMAGQHRP